MKKEKNKQNSFAHDIKGKPIHILEALRLRDDTRDKDIPYSCMGEKCQYPMTAVDNRKNKKISFFRHYAENVKNGKRACKYSSTTYQHEQAIIILNIVKKVKVPPLYKYPPKGVEGLKNLIEESKYIEAAYTKRELQFYQTDDLKVKHYDKDEDVENKHDLIIPDVTFFNEKHEPILFVEIVVTHKVDKSKLEKIRKLDIDTVEIKIPPEASELDIEKLFEKTTKTKWIYNHKEAYESYKYIPIPKDSEGLSLLDKQQRKIFETKWSYKCRANQLNAIIREIRVYLQKESYRRIEDRLERELSGVKKNTEREKREYEELRAGIQEQIDREFRGRREGIETRRRKMENEKTNLGRRYNSKRSKIEGEQEALDESQAKIQKRVSREFRERREKIEEQQGEFKKEETDMGNRYKSKDRELRELQDEFDKEFNFLRKGLDRGLERRISELRKERVQVNNRQDKVGGEQKRTRETTSVLKRKNREAENVQEDINREIQEYRTAPQRIKNRDGGGTGILSERIKDIISKWETLSNWAARLETITKYKNAIQRIENKDYKTWT